MFEISIMMFFSLFALNENFVRAEEFQSSLPNNDIVYVSKVVCGSIWGSEGPLRPGHYDTDVGIFNKQNYPISYFWNVAINNGPTTHSILQTIEKQQTTSILCSDIKKILGLEADDNRLVEGFVFINVPIDYNISSPNTIIQHSSNSSNLLEVQTFYTANALDTLPHEVILEKISFYIIQDGTGKIPKDMIRTTLDITIYSKLNQISNTETKVKQILADSYDIATEDLDKVVVRIKDISLGVSALIDDHAISLHVVSPQSSQGGSD